MNKDFTIDLNLYDFNKYQLKLRINKRHGIPETERVLTYGSEIM